MPVLGIPEGQSLRGEGHDRGLREQDHDRGGLLPVVRGGQELLLLRRRAGALGHLGVKQQKANDELYRARQRSNKQR